MTDDAAAEAAVAGAIEALSARSELSSDLICMFSSSHRVSSLAKDKHDLTGEFPIVIYDWYLSN